MTDVAPTPGGAPGPKHISVRLFKLLFAVVLAFGLALAPVRAQEEGPEAVVERLNAALIEVMRSAEELGYGGRYAELEPVLRETFDFPFMTGIAVGRPWRELGQAERRNLIELFSEMSIATFAARFDGYSGEEFEIVGQRPGPRDAVLIESRLVRPVKEPIGLDYLLRRSATGDWRIIDVFLDSKFSELARQRSEFSAVLRDRGYAGLVATIEDKIATLAGEDAS